MVDENNTIADNLKGLSPKNDNFDLKKISAQEFMLSDLICILFLFFTFSIIHRCEATSLFVISGLFVYYTSMGIAGKV